MSNIPGRGQGVDGENQPDTLVNPGPDSAPPADLDRAAFMGWLHDDQRARWQRGERPNVEGYLTLLAHDPRLDDEGVLDLIYAEVVVRTERGESPEEQEYRDRFPRFAPLLRRQFALHRALESSASLRASDDTTDDGPATPLRKATPDAVPGYQILGELGRGGMGVVWKARQAGLNRTVALKMILAGPHAEAGQLERFRTEAEAVARFQHPNIVQIYEVGEHDGLPFFSMEFAEGGSLAQKLSGTPQTPRDSARLTETLARAVHAAHQKRVVHRDLKPANILLTADGTPKVTDFGLAKRLDAEDGQTRTGQVLGTPSYMAPEQADGRLKDLGPAADVYSLGAILYETLTGRPPLKGASLLETLELVRSQDPLPVRALVASVPRDLETVCLKCLRKEPENRYITAAELADDLRRFLDGEPIRARPVGAVERALRWARRQPTVAALAAAVIVVTAAGFVGVTALWREAAARAFAEGLAKEDAQRAWGKEAEARRAEADARSATEASLYRSNIGLAHRDWLSGNIDRTKMLLRDCPDEFRGWEWRYVQRLCHTELFTVYRRGPGSGSSMTFSPDGKQLVSGDRDPRSLAGLIRVWNADNGAVQDTFGPDHGEIFSMSFSPDGRRLVTACGIYSRARLEVWDVAARRPVLTLRGHAGRPTSVAFSPDGKQIACAGGSGTVWDANTGRPITFLRGHPVSLDLLAYSPDGRHLACGDLAGEVSIWEAATGRKLQSLRGHTAAVDCIAYDPRQKRLASASADRTVIVWDSVTGRELRALRGHGDTVRGVAFSSDGRYLASAGADNTVRIWNPSTGEELRTLRGHARSVSAVAFQPDSTRLASASADGTLKVWDATAAQEARVLRAHTGGVTGVAFSSDGRRFVTGGEDKVVKLWDAKAGTVLRKVGTHAKRIGCIAFCPWSGRVASGADDGVVKVCDEADGAELLTLTGHGKEVRGLAFHPEGGKLASAGWDSTVRLWDVSTGEQLARFDGPPGPIDCVAFSPDGGRVAAGCREVGVKLWDVASRQEVLTLPTGKSSVWGVKFSPDGSRVAAAVGALASTAGEVRLWDARTGEELHSLRGHTGLAVDVAFASDGRRLASAGSDKVVRVWDVEAGQDTLLLHGHTNSVHAVTFSPDGNLLISAGFEGTVRVWDGTSLRLPRPPRVAPR